MYAMLGLCLDLAYAISVLSKFNATPEPCHLAAAKRILRYLKETKESALMYIKGSSKALSPLHGYTDSDWAGDVNDRKSTGGYVFLLQNGAISWKARKQTTVTLSSTEAEYVAASEAAKEAIWLRCLFIELDKDSNGARPTESEFCLPPTLIYGDNQGSIKITHNPQFYERTKHIDIKHHFIRTAYEDKHIALEYTPTAEITADILTKPLARDLHEQHCHGMGLQLVG